MKYSESVMWKAVKECSKEYDGEFFYVVKTVGVYCRPSCRSKQPLRKNVLFFENFSQAENAGFRPCKRCRPELTDYSPALKLAKQIKNLVDRYFSEKQRLSSELNLLGFSKNHLSYVFKQQYGLSLSNYSKQKQVAYVKKSLAETDLPIIEIAYDAGFESLSAFYTFFKKHVKSTPKNYRMAFKACR